MRMMLVALTMALCACGDSAPAEPAATSDAVQEPASEGTLYECPMHCKLEGQDEPYRQGEPGKCPVCGMDLEPQSKE